jgi:SAM-dependent methyltransferase
MDRSEASAPAKPVLEWALAMLGSQVLFTGAEVGLFTELAGQPSQTADEIADALGLHPRMVPDFLDALVVMGLLRRDADRYRNSPAAQEFLDAAKPAQYLGGFLDFVRDMLAHRVTRLTGALRSGLPQGPRGATAEDLREIYASPPVARGWAGMTVGLSMDMNRALARVYSWPDHASVADVGCAGGAVLAQILLRHPHLSGVGFDLPQMRAAFEEYAGTCGLGDRARFQAGDFLADPLPEADVIVLGQVLADFDDGTRGQILAKAYACLPPRGAVLMYAWAPGQALRDDLSDLYKGLLLGLTTAGGGTYGTAESAKWLREAGFGEVAELPLHGPVTLIVGTRR